MKVVETAAKKAKAHTVYKRANGKRVPGATTITGVLNKPALVRWANNLGLQGIDVSAYVDDLAGAGTCGHLMIENHIRKILGIKVDEDFGQFTGDQIGLAENVFLKFLQWEKENAPKYLGSEMQLVHEEKGYGGTVDCYCEIGAVKTLLDFKTSKGVYPDHYLQVGGGYGPLLEVNGHEVQDVRILRIGRDESEGDTDYIQVPHRKKYERIFDLCREIYEAKKEVKW